jgi:hypothetical protein
MNQPMTKHEVISEMRYTMAQAALSFVRAVAVVLYDGKLGPHILNIYFGTVIFIGQHEGRPFTAHKLSQFLVMPRATVIRRLEAMTKAGTIERRGTKFFITDQWMDDPAAVGMLRELFQVLNSACARLSAMDKSALDSSKSNK